MSLTVGRVTARYERWGVALRVEETSVHKP
jgi:hypothetical protein